MWKVRRVEDQGRLVLKLIGRLEGNQLAELEDCVWIGDSCSEPHPRSDGRAIGGSGGCAVPGGLRSPRSPTAKLSGLHPGMD